MRLLCVISAIIIVQINPITSETVCKKCEIYNPQKSKCISSYNTDNSSEILDSFIKENCEQDALTYLKTDTVLYSNHKDDSKKITFIEENMNYIFEDSCIDFEILEDHSVICLQIKYVKMICSGVALIMIDADKVCGLTKHEFKNITNSVDHAFAYVFRQTVSHFSEEPTIEFPTAEPKGMEYTTEQSDILYTTTETEVVATSENSTEAVANLEKKKSSMNRMWLYIALILLCILALILIALPAHCKIRSLRSRL